MFAFQEGNTIQQILKNRYGKNFFVKPYQFNSLIGKTDPKSMGGYEITDPYGTLSGSVFFLASPDFQGKSRDELMEDKSVIGFYRNGSILWDSGELIPDGVDDNLMGTLDMNQDGQVDLLFHLGSWDNESNPYTMWVISWNGTRGKIINDIDPETGRSAIKGNGVFEIFDYEGDNIFEIRTRWEKDNALFPDTLMSVRPCITYSWNGSLYGMWPTTPQLSCRTFLPRNRLAVFVKCDVTKDQQNNFIYNYAWTNKLTSKQKIQTIWLEGVYIQPIFSSPSHWGGSGAGPLNGLFWDILDWKQIEMIKPGKTQAGFGLKCHQLPTIGKYYVQGETPSPKTEGDEPDFTQEELQQDIYTNSIKGFTIGPIDTSIVFTSDILLDSLLSYTTQSKTLGWIKDQSTSNKYLNSFSTAKTQLQANNSIGARQTLQTVIANTISDSLPASGGQASNITSEAYALLRFNTEYLISQLPPPTSPYLPVKLITSIGTKLAGGTLQYYEGAWKDAINNNDGTFSVDAKLKTLSLRMTYEYGSQQKNNVTVGSDTIVFQTVNTQVKLQNSLGNPIDTGTVQYYAGAWRTFGTTANGVAVKELLPVNYTFRMTYAYGSNDKAQDLSVNPIVTFQTVNSQLQLKNSGGS
ncbi:MAG: hypothetical protein PHP42_06200, partial [Bacteroidota bacterium]|nr:hypothetical protein [Bacteroidota bacterium]